MRSPASHTEGQKSAKVLRPPHTLRFFSRRLATTVLSRRKESWDCLTPCDSLRLDLHFLVFCPHLLHCDANISKRKIKTMDDELKLLLSCGSYLLWRRFSSRPKTRRKWWCRPWLGRREQYGAYHTLFREMREEDKWSFKNFARLNPELFNELKVKLEPLIGRQNTTFRRCISTGERLAITLRFLATGTVCFAV